MADTLSEPKYAIPRARSAGPTDRRGRSPARRPARGPRLAVGLGLAWALLVLILAAITDPTPANAAYLLAIPASGAYTLLLGLTRPLWLPRLSRRPIRSAALLSMANAVVVETIFLVAERITGAQDVAAHPNLLIDLLITMPWYVLLAITFVRVQHRQRFAPATVLLLGALYELGGDGVAGPLVGLLMGDARILAPAYWLQMTLIHVWAFIPVYSSLVLPPAWVVSGATPPNRPKPPAWRDALKPLVWVLPFALYVALCTLVLCAAAA